MTHPISQCAAAALSLVICSEAFSSETGPVARVTEFSWAYLSKLGVALVSVLLIFMFFAWVMRRHSSFGSSGHQGLELVASLNVGQRERIVVVQAGTQQIVLGVTQTQINHLTELEVPLNRPETASVGSFRSNLEQMLRKERS